MILKAEGKFDAEKREIEVSLEFQPVSEAEHEQLCGLLHGEVGATFALEHPPECDLLGLRLVFTPRRLSRPRKSAIASDDGDTSTTR